MIISDSQRRDHLSFYGNTSIRTQNLERLADKSTVFENAYASSFPTVPARGDFMTGRWNFTYVGWAPMPQGELVLPEILGGEGYRTMAVVDTPFYMRDGFRYDHGFDIFEEIYGQALPAKLRQNYIFKYRVREEDYFAPQTFTKAQLLLERFYREKPFFLMIDTWDPHEPWDPPSWYVELYRPNYDGTVVYPIYNKIHNSGITEEEVDIAHDCYKGEITMVDHWIGSLLAKLEDLKLMDNTIIIYTSDHGFYFGEHGIFGKGIKDNAKFSKEDKWKGDWLRSPLYEEVTHVPLVIYDPDYEPKRISNLARNVDLMPTILDLLGVDIPSTVQGTSFAGLVRGDQKPDLPSAIISFPLSNPGMRIRIVDSIEREVKEFLPSTVTTKEWSLIYSAKGEPVELYNLKNDPRQENNVVNENHDIAKQLHSDFLNLIKSSGADPRLIKPREEITF